MPLSETASRPEHRIRDVVSVCGFVRKACSTLSAHSGVQFPPETPPEKHIPVWSRNLGCSFRLKGDPESTSHSEWQFRVTVSADTRRQSAAHITCLQICDPETQKTADRMLFFKKYTSRNLPSLHNLPPFTVADYRPPIQTRNMSPKAGHLPAWLDFGQLLVSWAASCG